MAFEKFLDFVPDLAAAMRRLFGRQRGENQQVGMIADLPVQVAVRQVMPDGAADHLFDARALALPGLAQLVAQGVEVDDLHAPARRLDAEFAELRQGFVDIAEAQRLGAAGCRLFAGLFRLAGGGLVRLFTQPIAHRLGRFAKHPPHACQFVRHGLFSAHRYRPESNQIIPLNCPGM